MSDLTVGTSSQAQGAKPVQNKKCPCCKGGNLQEEVNDAKQQTPLDPSRVKHIAEHVSSDKDIKWTDPKLQDCLNKGLCTKADGLIYAEEKEDNCCTEVKQEVIGKLNRALKHDLTAVEVIVRNGTDDLEHEDRKIVATSLKKSLDETKTITENSSMMSFLGEIGERLRNWVFTFYDFILDFFREIEEEEEKRKKEKQCEERCRLKEEFYVARRKAEEAKNKKRYYKALIHEMVQKIRFEKLKKAEKENANNTVLYAKEKSRQESLKADHYENEKCDIVCSMPPASVCGDSLNLELDITC